MPLDSAYSLAYQIAAEENECLWSLLGKSATWRTTAQQPQSTPPSLIHTGGAHGNPHIPRLETYRNPKTGVEKPLTERQRLAQAMGSIMRRESERGISAGLNRSVRWKADSAASTASSKTGNAANAEAAAIGRAKQTTRRRTAAFKNLKCTALIGDAGINASHRLETGSYGFAIVGTEIVLARVLTMYAKKGSKASAYSFVADTDTINGVFYLFLQTFDHLQLRSFRKSPQRHSALGSVLRFEHLTAHSFLRLLPCERSGFVEVRELDGTVTIGQEAYKMWKDLNDERDKLGKCVATLNAVKGKGGAKNIMEIEEEDDDLSSRSPGECIHPLISGATPRYDPSIPMRASIYGKSGQNGQVCILDSTRRRWQTLDRRAPATIPKDADVTAECNLLTRTLKATNSLPTAQYDRGIFGTFDTFAETMASSLTAFSPSSYTLLEPTPMCEHAHVTAPCADCGEPMPTGEHNLKKLQPPASMFSVVGHGLRPFVPLRCWRGRDLGGRETTPIELRRVHQQRMQHSTSTTVLTHLLRCHERRDFVVGLSGT
ncbi:hypothetical protein HMN09_00306100 [Mycena chlorophos]|uniref:Uncharacterized protein n=1 Tax=Mycena chlorophos TaxID=658473 RepID=A0A8H6TLW9_MYCCL|nr:hypothetical protein HMN09_00306100 [Mycena chlorophos]